MSHPVGLVLFIFLIRFCGSVNPFPRTGYVISGTYTTQPPEAQVDLYTSQALEAIERLRLSGDLKSLMSAINTFVRNRYSHKRETVTKLFTSIKAAILDKRNELLDWRIESRFGVNRRVMVDLPDIALGMIAQEVDEFCRQVVEMLEKRLLVTEKDPVLQCSYMSLKADYMRYRAEFASSHYKKSRASEALDEYKLAERFARNSGRLSDSSEIVLGILLNRSVLEYEIMDDKVAATETCIRALENAHKKPSGIVSLFTSNVELSDTAVCILQSIKRNMETWNIGVTNREVDDEWVICDVTNAK